MRDIKTRFNAALDFERYLDTVRKNRELWTGIHQRVWIPAQLIDEARSILGTWHLLALSEDWCGDAMNILPVVAELVAAAPNLDLRILSRDQNPDLMETHLTRGVSRSIPVVIVYDKDFHERGWWGPRPEPIQDWVVTRGWALEKGVRYKEVRQYYARDKGRTIIREILDLMRHVAGTPAAAG